MKIGLNRLSKLETLANAATPAPWEPDTEDCEGSFGSGPNTEEGYKSYTMSVPADRNNPHGQWWRLFDSLNSNAGEIQVEEDEDGAYKWDQTAERNFAFIAAMRRDALELISDAREAQSRISTLEAQLAEALSRADVNEVKVGRLREVLKKERDALAEGLCTDPASELDRLAAINTVLAETAPDAPQPNRGVNIKAHIDWYEIRAQQAKAAGHKHGGCSPDETLRLCQWARAPNPDAFAVGMEEAARIAEAVFGPNSELPEEDEENRSYRAGVHIAGRIRAAIPACAPAADDGWNRDMASAPRDENARVLINTRWGVVVAHRMEHPFMGSGWFAPAGSRGGQFLRDPDVFAWRPLPPPPRDESAK